MILSLATRHTFRTLRDAITLQSEHDERDAIIYLETDRPPVVVSRREFRRATAAYAAALEKMGPVNAEISSLGNANALSDI